MSADFDELDIDKSGTLALAQVKAGLKKLRDSGVVGVREAGSIREEAMHLLERAAHAEAGNSGAVQAPLILWRRGEMCAMN